uniref:Putative gamma-interferon inducible lysosomal thiol reductase n=1 Tax=Ixodes ricinus TaxID=34613 RepID=A0A0K8RMH8_IXORI
MKILCYGWAVGVAFVCLFVGQSLADIFDSIDSTENEISDEDNNQYRKTYPKPGRARYPSKVNEKEKKDSHRRKDTSSAPARPPITTPALTTTTTEAPTAAAVVPSTPASPPSSDLDFGLPNYGVVQSGSSQSLSVSVKKVAVTVIYECFCPHSQEFIKSQLLPTYKKLRDHLDVTLLPFGKARLDQNGPTSNGVICEHGSAECEGNKIQMCVAQVAKETLQTIEVVACMSSYKVPNKAARKCVKASGVSWTMVHGCVTKNGNTYILKVAQETWKVQKNITRVPLIAVDGEVSSYIQEESQSSFLSLTCQKIGGVGTDQEPEPCAEERRRRRRR